MKPNPMERLINGIVKENPTFVLMLGMCPGIRTRSGMTFLNAEMIMLENINTAVVESPIPAPLIADVVTANVGHIPNIIRR